MRNNVVLEPGALAFLDLHQKYKLNEITHNALLTSDIVAVDSRGVGIADMIYVGDEKGNLWKINLQNWTHQQYKLGLPGSIIGKPIVGRHPSGVGVLIYLLTQIKLSKHQVINVFSDYQHVIKPFYTIEEEPSLGQPILRQGYLIVQDKLNDYVK